MKRVCSLKTQIRMKASISLRSIILYAIIIPYMLLSQGCLHSSAPAQQENVILFAGAGMTDVLNELIDSFKVTHNASFTTNWASSGTLVRQMENGATPDLFIAASKKWADYADSLGFVVHPYKKAIAKNSLVLITPKSQNQKPIQIDSTINIGQLIGNGIISIGDPNHVPAGSYAQQVIDYYGWGNQLKGKILPAKDVRSAMMVVEMGEVPFGIVYLTDALKSQKVSITSLFPEETHQPIVFVASVCNKKNKMAIKYFEYITAKESGPIWKKHGFK